MTEIACRHDREAVVSELTVHLTLDCIHQLFFLFGPKTTFCSIIVTFLQGFLWKRSGKPSSHLQALANHSMAAI